MKELEAKIEQNITDFTKAKSATKDLKERESQLETDKASLESQVESMQAALEQAQKELDQVDGEKATVSSELEASYRVFDELRKSRTHIIAQGVKELFTYAKQFDTYEQKDPEGPLFDNAERQRDLKRIRRYNEALEDDPEFAKSMHGMFTKAQKREDERQKILAKSAPKAATLVVEETDGVTVYASVPFDKRWNEGPYNDLSTSVLNSFARLQVPVNYEKIAGILAVEANDVTLDAVVSLLDEMRPEEFSNVDYSIIPMPLLDDQIRAVTVETPKSDEEESQDVPSALPVGIAGSQVLTRQYLTLDEAASVIGVTKAAVKHHATNTGNIASEVQGGTRYVDTESLLEFAREKNEEGVVFYTAGEAAQIWLDRAKEQLDDPRDLEGYRQSVRSRMGNENLGFVLTADGRRLVSNMEMDKYLRAYFVGQVADECSDEGMPRDKVADLLGQSVQSVGKKISRGDLREEAGGVEVASLKSFLRKQYFTGSGWQQRGSEDLKRAKVVMQEHENKTTVVPEVDEAPKTDEKPIIVVEEDLEAKMYNPRDVLVTVEEDGKQYFKMMDLSALTSHSHTSWYQHVESKGGSLVINSDESFKEHGRMVELESFLKFAEEKTGKAVSLYSVTEAAKVVKQRFLDVVGATDMIVEGFRKTISKWVSDNKLVAVNGKGRSTYFCEDRLDEALVPYIARKKLGTIEGELINLKETEKLLNMAPHRIHALHRGKGHFELRNKQRHSFQDVTVKSVRKYLNDHHYSSGQWILKKKASKASVTPEPTATGAQSIDEVVKESAVTKPKATAAEVEPTPQDPKPVTLDPAVAILGDAAKPLYDTHGQKKVDERVTLMVGSLGETVTEALIAADKKGNLFKQNVGNFGTYMGALVGIKTEFKGAYQAASPDDLLPGKVTGLRNRLIEKRDSAGGEQDYDINEISQVLGLDTETVEGLIEQDINPYYAVAVLVEGFKLTGHGYLGSKKLNAAKVATNARTAFKTWGLSIDDRVFSANLHQFQKLGLIENEGKQMSISSSYADVTQGALREYLVEVINP